MNWMLVAGGVLVGLVGVIFIVGALLPEDHVASVSRVVPGAQEDVWEVLTEISRFPEWRPGVSEVERLDDRNGRPAWREKSATGTMTLEVAEWTPPRRMVMRVADPGLPFGGTWTFEVEPAGEGTRVTITENGEIYNPFFRFMARFVFGYEGTARTYLEGLQARMSGAVGPGGGS